MTRTHRTLSASLALALASAAHAATPKIEEIAPPDTIAVLSVDDFASLHESFNQSFMGKFWRDEEMQAWVDRFIHEGGFAEDFAENGPGPLLEEALDNADMRREDLKAPSGPVGAAMWWGEDTDTEEFGPRWVVIADFGDHSEQMRAFSESLIDALRDEESELEITEHEYEGADVWSIELADDAEDEAADDGFGDDEDWDDWEDYEPEPMLDHGHVAWIGNVMIIAGDNGALERAVNRINGEEMDSLADTNAYLAAHGSHDNAPLFGAAFVAPMLEAWLPDEAMMGFDPDPMLEVLGILEIRSLSGALRFDGPGGAIVQTYNVHVPQKKGLVALFDNRMAGFTLPSFIGADTSGVTKFQIDWSGVIPLANQVANAISDEDQRMNAQMMIGLLAGGLSPILEGMGPESLVVNSIDRPFAADSKQMYAAFEVKNRDAITNGFNAMQGALPIESRDFQGNQIWDLSPGTSLGLGFGRIFSGPTHKVEDALRQAGAGDAASLSEEDDFRDATRYLKGGAMLYSWQNNRDSYEYSVWMIENMEQFIRAQFEGFDFDDETIDEIVEEQTANNPFSKVGMPPIELVFRYFGESTVFEVHSSDDGFRGRGLMLPAEGLD